jgi:transposase InsO family protein
MGLPKLIKTDNGSSYASKNFTSFCKKFGIKHKTGISYNLMEQKIVKRVHRTLKNWLFKTKQGQLYPPKSPKAHLAFALFVLNFLQTDIKGQSAADRHWHPVTSNSVESRYMLRAIACVPPVISEESRVCRELSPL